MPKMVVDNETSLVSEHYAVIYAPRQDRKRFPQNCVEIHASLDEAMEASDPENHRHPAKVYGPSRSSEGLMLYYLVHWL